MFENLLNEFEYNINQIKDKLLLEKRIKELINKSYLKKFDEFENRIKNYTNMQKNKKNLENRIENGSIITANFNENNNILYNVNPG